MCAASRLGEDLSQEVTAFVQEKVLKCFPVASIPFKVAHTYNHKACRLLIVTSDAKCEHNYQRVQVEQAPSVIGPTGTFQGAGTDAGLVNLMQVSLSASQAFAAWTDEHQDRSAQTHCGHCPTSPLHMIRASAEQEGSPMIKPILVYCKTMLRCSEDSGPDGVSTPWRWGSSCDLYDVLQTVGTLLQLV